jgi:hypothetical protein
MFTPERGLRVPVTLSIQTLIVKTLETAREPGGKRDLDEVMTT